MGLDKKEKTISKNDASREGFDTKTQKELNEYNPIDGFLELDSDILTEVTIESVEVPPIKNLLNEDIPKIKLELSHKEITKRIKKDIILDSFINDDTTLDENSITLTSLLKELKLTRKNINKLENKTLSVTIFRDDSNEYNINLEDTKPSRIIQSSNYRLPEVSNISNDKYLNLLYLWKAKRYGKARIVGLNHKYKNIITVDFEIPWTGEVKSINFSHSSSNSDYYNLNSLIVSILGREPINPSEYDLILDKEIEVNYNDGFSLDTEKNPILEKNKPTFFDYLKEHKNDLKIKFSNNFLFFSILSILPPFTIIPFSSYVYIYSISSHIGAISFLLIVYMLLSLTVTIEKAYKSYSN